MIMGLLLPDARKMAVAAETSREPRGTSRTFLDKRVDAIVHQTHRPAAAAETTREPRAHAESSLDELTLTACERACRPAHSVGPSARLTDVRI
jgi:hypothetical protein